MDQQSLARRRFIVSIVALSAVGASMRSGLFTASQAWAEASAPLDPELHAAMVRMARLLFPHDALSDDTYAEILDQALSATATSDAFTAHLEAASRALDASAGGRWADMDETAQISAMAAIESEPFFAAIRDQVRAGVYMSAAFWEHVGYPGPSKHMGGYLNRGAGDIDWLPEDA